MGIEPYLVAATVQGILAQRLVRVLCTSCRGPGCAVCSQTGFKGRTGIFELVEVSEAQRQLVVNGAALSEVRALAGREGTRALYDDGMRAVASGITTREEVLRVCGAD
jgi:general secretion pathway protein E